MSGSAFDFSVITQVTGTLETLSLYAMPGTDNSGLETFNATVTYDQTKVAKVESKKVTSDNVSVTQVTGWGTPVVNKGTGQIGIGITDGSTDGSYALAQSSTPDLIGTITFTLVSGASPVSGNITFTSYSSTENPPGYINQANTVAYAACFVTGTRIRTERGDVAVEHLRAGVDRVITAEGRVAPINWIGHRAADNMSTDDRPVRLRAHCIGPDLPERDLLVSPEHAIFLDGALYPAASLVNTHSIGRADLDSVTYFHILLDRHDIILAEGLPTESFLPNDNWDQFDNAASAPVSDALVLPCAPRITQGARLQAVLDRIDTQVFA